MQALGEAEDMPTDVRPRSYGLKRHGAKAARVHKMALLLLVTMEVLLNRIEPFHRFVGEAMMKDPLFRHPLKHNTMPFWAVGVLAVLGPMVTVTGIHMMKRSVYDLYHAILGLHFSVLITGVLTDAIKDVVGRPSPNFFWRCFPDGIPNYNNVTTEVICHGHAAVVKEGYKSFPSGHSSLSFAGLGFLSWYLAGKIRALDREGQATKLCIIAFPLLLAALVAVSRVSDNWHHWQDVCAGGILGLVVATLCYLHFIPSPFGKQALCPNAYYRHILNADMGNQRRSTNTVNCDQSHHDLYQEYVEVEMTRNSQSLDSMEAGNIAR